MITQFKIFDNLNNDPEIGDFVIINSDHEIFDKNKVGSIEDIDNDDINNPIYYIYYPNSTNVWRPCNRSNIEYCSKYKEDAEQYLQNKKFNL